MNFLSLVQMSFCGICAKKCHIVHLCLFSYKISAFQKQKALFL